MVLLPPPSFGKDADSKDRGIALTGMGRIMRGVWRKAWRATREANILPVLYGVEIWLGEWVLRYRDGTK